MSRFVVVVALCLLGSNISLGQQPCTDGFAGSYPCKNIDLQAFMPKGDIGGGNMSDVWGWTDPTSGREYVLAARASGVSFVDITQPLAPVFIGNLPTQSSSSGWRDVKVYNDHAFIVADNTGEHGMQVFDLKRLRAVTTPPVEFSANTVYRGVTSAHNIAINEDSGFAYVVGSPQCAGGLHMVDISEPLNARFAGCFSEDGYTHDVQCVNYVGPDADYAGREICFASNTDTVTIVDVSDKESPEMIFRAGYPGSGYVHQGWLTADQSHFVQNDELDERSNDTNTRTNIWDVTDLDSPILAESYYALTTSIDHNLYNRGDYTFQSNYTAGLRILDIADPLAPEEVAYFDTYPSSDRKMFAGSWSNYPYFNSGNIAVTSIGEGLFVLKPTLSLLPVEVLFVDAVVNSNANIAFAWQVADETNIATYEIQLRDGSGSFRSIQVLSSGNAGSQSREYSVDISDLPAGPHVLRLLIRTSSGEEYYSNPVSAYIPLESSHEITGAYPNPFSHSTRLGILVKEEQDVRIIVYDVAGRERVVLHDGRLSPDAQNYFRVSATGLPAGTYFVRFAGELFNETISISVVN